MDLAQTMAALESFGSPQTRKTYTNHGIHGPMFGVKWGDLGKLARKIKIDHDLALALWETGNFDARNLAAMVVDPERMTAKALRAWLKDVQDRGLCFSVASIAAKSPAGRKLMLTWLGAKKEWPGYVGWAALALVLKADPDFADKDQVTAWLDDIEQRIHTAPNSTRYAMNDAVIAIGSHVPGMLRPARAAARRIGPVDVDHGKTSCKTPDAVASIDKAVAKRRAKKKG